MLSCTCLVYQLGWETQQCKEKRRLHFSNRRKRHSWTLYRACKTKCSMWDLKGECYNHSAVELCELRTVTYIKDNFRYESVVYFLGKYCIRLPPQLDIIRKRDDLILLPCFSLGAILCAVCKLSWESTMNLSFLKASLSAWGSWWQAWLGAGVGM